MKNAYLENLRYCIRQSIVALLVSGVVLIGYQCSAQTTFNKRFHLGPHTVITSITPHEGRFFVNGVVSNTSGGFHTRFFTSEFDENGIMLWNKIYGGVAAEYFPEFDTALILNDSTYLVASASILENINYLTVLWFNLQGDTLSARVFESPYAFQAAPLAHWITCTRVIQDGNGDLYFLNKVYSVDTMNDMYLFKTNPEGELIWDYTFATESIIDLSYCIGVYGNSLILGAGISASEPSPVKKLIFLEASTGAETNTIDIESFNSGHFRAWEMMEDGLVVASASGQYNPIGVLPMAFKLGYDGSLQWTCVPDAPYIDNQFSENIVRALDGSGFVLSARHYDLDPPDPEINGSYNISGWLIKLDNDGNILWDRKYHYLVSDDEEHVIYELVALEDGYIFGGESDGCCDIPPSSYDQQAWLVKTDLCGCLVPGCDPNCAVSINDPAIDYEATYLLIGPNPASDYLNIHLLDEGFDQNRYLTLYDIQGNQLAAHVLAEGQTTYILNVGHFALGTYIAELRSEDGVLEVKRFVKGK